VRRREFISLLGGATVAWPLSAHAQQPAMPIVGMLNGGEANMFADRVAAFRQGLREAGYIEGQNVTFEYRWAQGQYDRLPALAADLVARQVSVIAATGGAPAAVAAKAKTQTIPIVFVFNDDPVKLGLVESYNRPGGNITGVSVLHEVSAKRVELLHELVPSVSSISVLLNPEHPTANRDSEDVRTAAASLGLKFEVLRASTAQEIETTIGSRAKNETSMFIVMPDPFFNSQRDQIIRLAESHLLPIIYYERSFVLAGGLISYGASLPDAYRQAGVYSGRILKGEKPGDLPIMQPTKFELSINLKTAKAMGLTVPSTLLTSADEVIE
jgi:putative ABC transport system substrate-binding protein